MEECREDSREYYMFYKPSGCVTAVRDAIHPTVMDYFKEVTVPGLHPAGRLDKNTEGLLFLTNDGQWNQRLMSPEKHVEKTYFFWAMGELSADAVRELEEGIEIRGGTAGPARFVMGEKGILGDIMDIATGIKKGNRREQPVFSGYLTIHEGKKHQVKRMIKAAGGYVVYLKRISIGGVSLDSGLCPGEFRKLTKEELKILSDASRQRKEMK